MRTYYILLIGAIFSVILYSCETNVEKGERLAKTYCSSCHLFPEPGLLDKKTWETSVLPRMGLHLGLKTFDYLNDVPIHDLTTFVSTLPASPVVSKDEWNQILEFYSKEAPDSLLIEFDNQSIEELSEFDVSTINILGSEQPMITLLQADTINHLYYLGTRQSWLYKLDQHFTRIDSIFIESPTSQLLIEKDGLLKVLRMGIMDPNDQKKGSLISLDFKTKETKVLIDSLKRPVFFERKDINNDGLEDYIICAFGNYTGELSVYHNLGNNQFKKNTINPQPGTRKVEIRDVDKDGNPDIIALIAQADEKVVLFLNKGDFKFQPKILARFPSVYGSSYMEVIDFNKDGYFDLVCTNGDNADFSVITKPYHGVRILLNDGKNNFTQFWFYPMPGASEVKARDFDLDGDVDLAVISFFPNFKNNPESFLYFENRGNDFEVKSTPLGNAGRWLRMECVDVDSDGDQDLLLSALNFRSLVSDSLFNQWKSENTGILFLENKLN